MARSRSTIASWPALIGRRGASGGFGSSPHGAADAVDEALAAIGAGVVVTGAVGLPGGASVRVAPGVLGDVPALGALPVLRVGGRAVLLGLRLLAAVLAALALLPVLARPAAALAAAPGLARVAAAGG